MTDAEGANALGRIADALEVIGGRLGDLVELGHAPTDIADQLRLIRAKDCPTLAEAIRERDEARALLEQAVERLRALQSPPTS